MRDLMTEAMATAILLVPVMNIIIEALKKYQIKNEYLATISLVLGVILGLAAGLWMNGDLFSFGIAGLFAGGTAAGLYDAYKGLTSKGE